MSLFDDAEAIGGSHVQVAMKRAQSFSESEERRTFAPVDGEIRDTTRVVTPMEENTMKVVVTSPPAPLHPVAAFRGAFTESMVESERIEQSPVPLLEARDRFQVMVMDCDVDQNQPFYPKWQIQPWQHHHLLWKLVAQISFGLHLLLHDLSRDKTQVLAIIQKHVTEMDDFLSVVGDDFQHARKDISERADSLRLPLDNMVVFEHMLEQAPFRNQIFDGNERIDFICKRTDAMMNEALWSVVQGQEACNELRGHLGTLRQDKKWQHDGKKIQIFYAMERNVCGWYRIFSGLQNEGRELSRTLVDLQCLVNEVNQKAEEVGEKLAKEVDQRAIDLRLAEDRARKVQIADQWAIKQKAVEHSATTDSAVEVRAAAQQLTEDINAPPIPPERSVLRLRPERVPSPIQTDNRNRGTQATQAMIQDHVPTPVIDKEPPQEPEIMLLKPHTYTPIASPSLPKDQSGEAATIGKNASQLSNSVPAEDPPYNDGYFGARQYTSTLSTIERESPSPCKSLLAASHALRQSSSDNGDAETNDTRLSTSNMQNSLPPVQTRSNAIIDPAPLSQDSGFLSGFSSSEFDNPRTFPSNQRRNSPSTRSHINSQPSSPTISIPRSLNYSPISSRPHIAGTSDRNTISPPPRRIPPVPRAHPNSQINPVAYLLTQNTDSHQQYSQYQQTRRAVDSTSYSATSIHNDPLPRHSSANSTYPSTPSERDFSLIHLPLPSPRSEQAPNFYRTLTPVQLSPHSPLQRPWTAAPTGPSSTASPAQQPALRNSPSNLAGRMLSHQSSSDNMSTMTKKTTKSQKEKRGLFGRIKKALTLSDEEKAAFDARRLGLADERARHEMPMPLGPRYLDGRRVD